MERLEASVRLRLVVYLRMIGFRVRVRVRVRVRLSVGVRERVSVGVRWVVRLWISPVKSEG